MLGVFLLVAVQLSANVFTMTSSQSTGGRRETRACPVWPGVMSEKLRHYGVGPRLEALQRRVTRLASLRATGLLPTPRTTDAPGEPERSVAAACHEILKMEKPGVMVIRRMIVPLPDYPDPQYKEMLCCPVDDELGSLVIQSRSVNYMSFRRDWNAYKEGFGVPSSDFWIGNALLAELTKRGDHFLMVIMEDYNKQVAMAKYDTFIVLPENQQFTLRIAGYSGDAGDGLSAHNNTPFSTFDRDNDHLLNGSCSTLQGGGGGWWFTDCLTSNGNGQVYYKKGLNKGGIVWGSDDQGPKSWRALHMLLVAKSVVKLTHWREVKYLRYREQLSSHSVTHVTQTTVYTKS